MKKRNIIFASLLAAALAGHPQFAIADSVEESTLGIQQTNQNPRKTITGVVMDTDGISIIGAVVKVKGTDRGTITDIDGRFTIEAAEGEELDFHYIGFEDITEKIGKDTRNLNIRMISNDINLDDVVVIAYGQQKKESVVSSMSLIGPAELRVKSANLTNSLAGKISGLMAVQQSGEPGWDNAKFWIRGVSSYQGGTDPLVLVDGVPRAMKDVDTDEIETFNVLKDAASTAVYGAEGANGVILITTKRGKQQKTEINASFQYGISTPLRLPNLMDSYNFLSLYNEAVWNDNGNPEVNFVSPVSDYTLDMYRTGADRDLYPNANWMDMLRSNTQDQRYTLNFRGGGEKVRFFVSGAYYTTNGIYKENKGADFDSNISFSRYNLRSNIDFDMTKSTRMSVDMSGQYINRVAPSKTADEIFNGMTLLPVHLIPMIYSDGTPSEHPESDGQGLRQNPYNFLYYSGYSKSWSVNFQTKVSLEQDLDFITKGLKIRGAVGFDSYSEQFTNRTMSAHSFYATGRDEEGNLIKQQRSAGSALGNPSTGSVVGNKKIYIETSLNYARTFNDKHDVTGLVLFNQKEEGKANVSGMELLPYRKQSVVGRVSYGFDNRYMLESSIGITGSENFAKGHRWGIFPSIGAAWFISHEKWFMESSVSKTLNKLKLRASYGKTGNDNLGDLGRFPYMPAIGGGGGINFGINNISNGGNTNWYGGRSEGSVAAPLLHWEVEDKSNFGIDLGMLNGRIDLTADYFFNRRKDILIRRNTIPSMTGLSQNPLQNFGIVDNQGIDGNIILQQTVNKLNLKFRGNFTYAKNKIVECDEIFHPLAYQDLTGHSLNTPYLYIAEGLYTPDDFNITKDPVTGASSYTLKEHMPNPGAAVSPGDIKYKDLNNDNKIDGNDQTYINGMKSTEAPEMVYGFALDAEYKGFFAAVFFQGTSGISMNLMSKAENFMPFNNGKDASSARMEAMDRWTASDPYNDKVLYPRMHGSAFSHNLRPSTWWYRSANYLRLKNIEFGYQFDRKQLKSLHMQNLRIYVQGQNLITWDNVKYWDPESKERSGAKYPLSRTWTMGIEVTF